METNPHVLFMENTIKSNKTDLLRKISSDKNYFENSKRK